MTLKFFKTGPAIIQDLGNLELLIPLKVLLPFVIDFRLTTS